MTEELTSYDPAEDLRSDQAITAFMTGAIETSDPVFIAYALDIVARATIANSRLPTPTCN
ncbi:hypothetical protein [Chitinimonas arctica]|uniref:hypothetical protein n=1 Tax=Chitinimonas arctica TaxID=2594795 RepID=UPI0015D3F052|nr:hypothetical protein [Chitinimonas arctica]